MHLIDGSRPGPFQIVLYGIEGWRTDTSAWKTPLQIDSLKGIFTGNTNISFVHDQSVTYEDGGPGSRYARAACRAYLNTIDRTHGARRPSSFADYFRIHITAVPAEMMFPKRFEDWRKGFKTRFLTML
jgi:hypothetical protein